jgi:hypothetical protein
VGSEERESSQDKRDRQDKEKDDYRKARQIRLGHVEAPKPKAKPKAEAKAETE